MIDLRLAWRALRRRPGFAAVVIATLALGLGIGAAVFSLVDALLLRPPPIADPERLLQIYSRVPGGALTEAPMAFPDVEDLAARSRTLDGVVAYAWVPLALRAGHDDALVMGELVSGDYFRLLGLEPALGRLLAPDDDRPGLGTAVAVLAHDVWRRRFDGDPAVVGRRLTLNGRDATVVGVAPAGFHGLVAGLSPELWLPLRAPLPTGVTIQLGRPTPGLDRDQDRAVRWVWAAGRLREGVDAGVAAAEVATIGEALARQLPDTNAHRAFTAVPAGDVRLLPAIDGALRLGGGAAVVVVLLVLLVASIDLAGLFLARALERRREIATRLALGAGRSRLIGQLLAEGLLLAAAGSGLGLGLAAGSNRLLARIELPIDWPLDLALAPAIDARVVAFTLVAATAAALVFALAPAWVATDADLAAAIRGAARRGAPRHRLRDGVLAAQTAIAVALLLAAGLALRGLDRAARLDPGLAAHGRVVASLAPELIGASREESARFFDRLLDDVRALPGVRSAALASHLPLTFAVNFAAVAAVEHSGEAVERWPPADAAAVGPGYFETLGIPLVAGRGFTPGDDAGAPAAVVVNETLAATLWPGRDPLGRRLRLAGAAEPATVVGVARDGRYRTLGEPRRAFVYRSLGQDPRGTRTLVARVDGPLEPALAALDQAARRLDARVPIGGLRSLESALDAALLPPRLAAGTLAATGLLGLLLAALGVAGVVAAAVSERTREIGLRAALGASRGRLLRWLLARALAPVAAGLLAGLALGGLATRGLGGFLYGLDPADPLTFVAVAAVLLLAATLAALVPAQRAVGVEPAAALRRDG